MGAPAPGYSSAQALKAIEEVGKAMPREFGLEWSGLTLQQKKSEGEAGVVFGMAVVFVFLLLAAQYESWALPFAVLLCTPLVVLGTLAGLLARGFDNNVYSQIGLVMLIGLAAKNAILIVEFAKLRREEGKPVTEAALEGAKPSNFATSTSSSSRTIVFWTISATAKRVADFPRRILANRSRAWKI